MGCLSIVLAIKTVLKIRESLAQDGVHLYEGQSKLYQSMSG